MCYSSSRFLVFLFLLILLALYNCKSGPSDPFEAKAGKFSKEEVTADTYTFNVNGSQLLAGTGEGVFFKKMSSNRWTAAGLKIDSSQVVDFAILNEKEILAAVKYDSVRQNKPILFKSNSSGESWNSVDVNKPEGYQYFVVHFLELQQNNSQNIFAYAGRVLKSTDRGKNWSIIYEEGYISEFLFISPYHPNQIWTGGWTNIFSPYLAKSEDGGDTWTLLNKNVQAGDATCYDVVLHPNDSDQVLVGMGGAVSDVNRIRKSTDSGLTWRTVLQGNNIRTLTHSTRNPEIIYASGINPQGTLFFAKSLDFGESWETVTREDGPVGVRVNDMISVMQNGREVLYLGTNKGIYSYMFEE